jgi:hypothetical protein
MIFLQQLMCLLADFDELDLQLVNPSAFFRDLEALQSMKIYEPGGEPTEYKLQYRKFWEDFGALYHALRERLISGQQERLSRIGAATVG